MKNFNLVFAMLAIVLYVSLVPANAEWITVAISGHITGVDDPSGHFGGQISINAPITGTYIYDSAVHDSNPMQTVGEYWYNAAPAGIYLNIGRTVFQTNSNNVNFLVGVNKDTLADYYAVQSRSNSPLSDGTTVEYISWQLEDGSRSALSSDALLLTAPDLSKWNSNALSISTNRDFGITATITSATPEPTTILLFGLGLLLTKRIH